MAEDIQLEVKVLKDGVSVNASPFGVSTATINRTLAKHHETEINKNATHRSISVNLDGNNAVESVIVFDYAWRTGWFGDIGIPYTRTVYKPSEPDHG